jgi:predicted metal-dependent enzyme (double-stranded beta helix superfamily)
MDDEYFVDAPVVRTFVERVVAMADAEPRRDRLVQALRPAFAGLLAAGGWLPEPFTRPNPSSGMGGGIAQYLLYRRADRSITLHAAVFPAGVASPVHDHLAWGIVGLYRGLQEEDVYRRADDGRTPGRAVLEHVERRRLVPGDCYTLLPPDGDIHRVRTVSPEASISIHLLGNDLGCIVRHRFDPEHGVVVDFKSGWANVDCADPPARGVPT